jgi:hypothetical protein
MTKAMLYRNEHVNGFGLVLAMPGATALSLYFWLWFWIRAGILGFI